MGSANKTILNIKVDKTLKQEAQELAEEIGVPLTTVVAASLKEFVRSRSLSLSTFPRLKPEIEQELAASIADYKLGKNISSVLSREDVAAHLKNL